MDGEVQWGALRPILQEMADRITRIEQFLAASGLQVPAQADASSGGLFGSGSASFNPVGDPSVGEMAAAAQGIDTGVSGDAYRGVPEHIVQMAAKNKMKAIKEYRSITGLGLNECKDAIDAALAMAGY
jgi:hypothetical protein